MFQADVYDLTNTGSFSTNFMAILYQTMSNAYYPVGSRILRSTNTPPPIPPYTGTWVMNDLFTSTGGAVQYIYQRTA
jgi:hypothetical protein